MNGVLRGAHFSTGKTLYVRCGGLRDNYVRRNGSSAIGFRLNGVDRGGHYSTAGLQNVRSGGVRLNNKRLNAVIDYIGFRCMNGVVRGTGTSASYVVYRYRSGYRTSSAIDYPTAIKGFRLFCEWCMEKWA